MKWVHILAIAAGLGVVCGVRAQTNTASTPVVTGVVLDAESHPVAGARVDCYGSGKVHLEASGKLKALASAMTDSNGAFGLTNLKSVGRAAVLVVRKPGQGVSWRVFNPSKDTAPKVILAKPSVLAGVVVDDKGQPVAGAEVYATQARVEMTSQTDRKTDRTLSETLAREVFSTRSGTNGQFRLEGFPTGGTAELVARIPGSSSPQEPASGSMESLAYAVGREDIRLEMQRLGTIEGKIVFDGVGQPYPVANLSLFIAASRNSGAVLFRTNTSAADGTFRFDELPSWDYRLFATFGSAAHPSEWVAEKTTIPVEPGMTNSQAQLQAVRGGLLQVTLLGETNSKALSKVTVSAYKQDYQTDAKPDTNGVALLRLPSGDYQITARVQGRSTGPVAATVQRTATNRVELTLEQPKRISGVVRGPDGKPAARIPIQLIFGQGFSMSDPVTDASGKFSLEYQAAEAERFGGSQAVSALVARDPEHNLAAACELDPNAASIELKLEPGLTLAGRAESEGKPLANCNAVVIFWIGNSGMGLSDLSRPVTNGGFEIPAMPVGYKYGIVVNAPGYGQAHEHATEVAAEPGRFEMGTFELKRANLKIAGQVVDNDEKPVANADVYLQGENQPSEHTRTDRQGRFVLQRACEGVAQLQASSQQSYGTVSAEGGDADVVIQLGQNYARNEGTTSHKLAGVITDSEGKPVPGAQAKVFPSENRRWVKADTNGCFKLTWAVAPWRLQSGGSPVLVVRDTGRNLAATSEISEDSTNQDIKLAPGVILSGRIQAAEGTNLAGAQISALFKTGNGSDQWDEKPVVTDAEGRYSIVGLPAGSEFILRAEAARRGCCQHQQTLPISSETNRVEAEPFVLKLADRVLAGQVVNEEDKPQARVVVSYSGENQPQGTVTTDKQGRFSVKVCEGNVRLYANLGSIFANATAEAGDTNVVLQLGRSSYSGSESPRHKLTGVVLDPAGEPVAGAQVLVFPPDNHQWVKTDTNGHFRLTWSIPSWRSQSGSSILVARDARRGLAVSMELGEDTTNQDLRLAQGVKITGLIQTPEGTNLSGAKVGLWFRTGNSYDNWEESPVATDSQGRFAIGPIPMDSACMVFAEAADRGRSQRNVSASVETNRIELEPIVLKPADRILSGRVVDQDDKPQAGVDVNLNGDDQPQGSVATDKQGRFSFKVCEGSVQLFANAQNSFGNTTATAGDTNVIIQLGRNSSSSPVERSSARVSLRGRPLPELTALGLETNCLAVGKPALICLFDMEQRPSRHVLQQLIEKVETLKQKGVTVLGIQAAVVTAESFKSWQDSNPVPFPVGRLAEKGNATGWVSSTKSLPWLLLTDSDRKVVAEGFDIDELEIQLKAVTK